MRPNRALAPLLACGLAFILQACAHAPVTTRATIGDNASAASDARCNAAAAHFAIGKEPSEDLVETARRQAGAHRVRVIRHDQMVTKEYLVGRLNLLLEESGRVREVQCG